MRRPWVVPLLALLLLCPGCRCSPSSPEERVRQTIDAVIAAVRERDIKPVANAVSEHYSDRERNDKQQVVSLVRMQFVVHPNLYLVTKISSIEFPEPAQARVLLFAALASVPAGVLPDLRNLSADVYRFDLAMADEDGTWRVQRASWAPATIKDLL
ncbi:MAG: hypothetical protein JXP73_11715 [Deltaproteobacteria bacterium]|nr:hypothetical protein [Deltaproteobacteria bacterium]